MTRNDCHLGITLCVLAWAVACGGSTAPGTSTASSDDGVYTLIVYETLSVPALTYSDASGAQIWITSGFLTLSPSGYYLSVQRESTYNSLTHAGEVDTLRAGGRWSVSGMFLTFTDTSLNFVTAGTVRDGIITDAFGSKYRKQ